MSYAYMERDYRSRRVFHFYSELDLVKKIIPLVIHFLDLDELLELEYRFMFIDFERINYLRLTLTSDTSPLIEEKDPFLGVFPDEFLIVHLPERELIEGEILRRSGFQTSNSRRLSIQTATHVHIFHELNRNHLEKVRQCRMKFKKSVNEPSVTTLHRLAEEFELEGGSWTIRSKNRSAATNSFLEILGVLKREQIPAKAFKVLRWKAHSNGQFSTEIVNNYSNYYTNYMDDAKKSELWYFSFDHEVKMVYRLLIKQNCVDVTQQDLTYKSEIVSTCNSNKSFLKKNGLWYLYSTLKQEDMLHITSEALSEAQEELQSRLDDSIGNEDTPTSDDNSSNTLEFIRIFQDVDIAY